MDTRRALLDALEGGAVSGPALADELGVSRAAVWKAVEALRAEGFAVESTADGYVAPADPPYSAAGIGFGLDAPYAIEFHDSIPSTNDRARELADEGRADVAVVGGEQTGGRGRLDRDWVSPVGGIWLSVLTRPSVPPAHAPVFTLAAAVATTDACREVGVDAAIKWPNDVLVGGDAWDGTLGESDESGKDDASGEDDAAGDDDVPGDVDAAGGDDRGGRKVAGILTEMTGEADRVSWLAVGIGVNANLDAADLPPGATSLREELRGPRGGPAVDDGGVDRRPFVQRLLERYHALSRDPDRILPAWRERASTLGARVRVETAAGAVRGTAVDVEFPGALVVDTGGSKRRIHAGDCEHVRPDSEE